MKRAFVLPVATTLFCSLAVASQVFGSGVLISAKTFDVAMSHGCALGTQPNFAAVKDLQQNLQSIAKTGKSMLTPTSVDCSTCTQTHNTNIMWCRDLPGGCWDGFIWHTNFEFEKRVDYYQCANDVTAVKCGDWKGSGCCGSDDASEPPCPSGNGLVPCETSTSIGPS